MVLAVAVCEDTEKRKCIKAQGSRTSSNGCARKHRRLMCKHNREKRRCKECPGGGNSLCQHGREKFRSKKCCPHLHASTKHVTVMLSGPFLFYKLARKHQDVKVGMQCSFDFSVDDKGEETVTLTKGTSMQDLRTLMHIPETVNLAQLGSTFTLREFDDVMGHL